MPATRRPTLDDRRRLVIYSQRIQDEPVTRSRTRSGAENEDDGQRSQRQAYGSRVHRRLRARWYGIVPVKRRTLWAFNAAVLVVVGVLAWAHWAAFWWKPIALHPEIARPLRLDRPDSFGTWLSVVMLALTAGLALLVYQLRRYRSDDYHGHYRIWRIVIVVCMVASVNRVTHLVEWSGATLDLLLGERDVLAGAEWIRLLLCVGGLGLGMRLTAEVARERNAAIAMGAAVLLLVVPVAVRWKFIALSTATATTWLPVLGLAAHALVLVGVMSYLRLLYREVRRVEESATIRERVRTWIPEAPWTHWSLSRGGTADSDDEEEESKAVKRTANKRKRNPARSRQEDSAEATPAAESTKRNRVSSSDNEEELEESATKVRRKFTLGWPKRNKHKNQEDESHDSSEDHAQDQADDGRAEEQVEAKAKRPSLKERLLTRRKPKDTTENAADPEVNDQDALAESSPAPKKRFGLGGFRSRNSNSPDVAQADPKHEEAQNDSEGSTPRSRFGLLKKMQKAGKHREVSEGDSGKTTRSGGGDADSDDAPANEKTEKRKFGAGLGARVWKRRDKDAESTGDTPEQTEAQEEGQAKSDRKSWLRLPFGRKTDAEAGEETDDTPSGGTGGRSRSEDGAGDSSVRERSNRNRDRGNDRDRNAQRKQATHGNAASAGDEKSGRGQQDSPKPSQLPADDDAIDPDSIDWSSLNKSERRRMRKLLKRQGRAA